MYIFGNNRKKGICLPRAANPAMSAPAKGLSFGLKMKNNGFIQSE